MRGTHMEQSQIIGVGIVGLGAIGEKMMQYFEDHPQTRVVAVCDTSAERAKKKVEELAGKVEWYTDHNKLLENESVDLVYVAVPPAFHHKIALDVLASKKHIFCEKPLASTLDEAKEMLDKAIEAGVVHAMNFGLNYTRPVRTLSRLLQEGYIGALRRIDLSMRFPQWPRPWQQNPWINSRKEGGFVLEVGSHFIQLIDRFFGPITPVQSEVEFPNDPNLCEIGIIAQMKTKEGIPIVFNGLSQCAGVEEERIILTFYGTKGTISLHDWAHLKGGLLREPIQEIPLLEDDTPAWVIRTNNIVQAMNGREAELYDFKVGYEIQSILETLRNP